MDERTQTLLERTAEAIETGTERTVTALGASERPARQRHRVMLAIAAASLLIAFITAIITWQTLVVSNETLTVSRETNDDVAAISTMSAQDVVNGLRLGMPFDELATYLGTRPVQDHTDATLSEQFETPARRTLFVLEDQRISVVALFDGLNEAWGYFVTALEGIDGGIGFPDYNSGHYALADFHGGASARFATGQTTLGELLIDGPETSHCLDGGIGYRAAGWAYLALGCLGRGYTNYDSNIVAINMRGQSGEDWVGRDVFGSGEPSNDGSAEADMINLDEVRPAAEDLTFNTIGWFRSGTGSFGPGVSDLAFEDFVATYEAGPLRDEAMG